MEKKIKLLGKLDELNIFYVESKNDCITVDRTSIWLKKEKWYDPIQNVKGIGINSYLNHITNGKDDKNGKKD